MLCEREKIVGGQLKRVHFVGIGGIGMSGLAKILLDSGVSVQGSDVKESPIIEELRRLGATITLHHAAENVKTATHVVHTSDVPKSNPEIVEAVRCNIPLLHRSDLLAALSEGTTLIAVTGTHGKTTTSSLLAHILDSSGASPSFAVGGIPLSLGTNAQKGNGDLFVIEADESDGTFLKYAYEAAIVTNVDTDHLAHYGSFEGIKEAFDTFIKKSKDPELLFLCGEDPFLRQFGSKGQLYGFSPEFPLHARNITYAATTTRFEVVSRGTDPFLVELPLSGQHNVLNTLASIGVALAKGIGVGSIQAAIRSFQGVKRRLEVKGVVNEIIVVDDYGHHPTEIKATIQAFRQHYGEGRISVFFQPHRVSRMKYILDEFTAVFDEADQLYITDLYSAGEAIDPHYTSQKIIENIQSGQQIPTEYIPKEKSVEILSMCLKPHEAILFFGAGDTNVLAEKLVLKLRENPPRLKVAVVYGGENSEHIVSCASSQFVFSALPPSMYQVDGLSIGTDGSWRNEQGQEIQDLVTQLKRYDIVFPVLHGPRGEDGRLQGLLDMLHIPYVGCSVLGCALAMDKARAKRLAASYGVLVVPWVDFSQYEWQSAQDECLEKICTTLKFPLIVKPSHLGSSVGVIVANKREELIAAIENALRIDSEVVVENCISVAHEIEIALLGNENPLVSRPGEILTNGRVYDYAAKYSKDGVATAIQAAITPEMEVKAIDIVKTVYRALGGSGLSRIDLLVDTQNNIYFNESNPLPGFTAISMYPQMMQALGVHSENLMIKLVALGLERHWNEKRAFRRQIASGELCGKLCSL